MVVQSQRSLTWSRRHFRRSGRKNSHGSSEEWKGESDRSRAKNLEALGRGIPGSGGDLEVSKRQTLGTRTHLRMTFRRAVR